MAPDEQSRACVELTVALEHEGLRLDAYLAQQFPDCSRVRLRCVINAAEATVDGRRIKAAHRLRAGQHVAIMLPPPPREAPPPEAIPIDVLYEDECLAVINKPAGMVVHPAKGHWTGTLAGGLTRHFQQLSSVGGPARPGIVHRLDRDTSGLMVVARTDRAHLDLAAQFEARTVEKEYFAIVAGEPDHDRDVIERAIGAHPYQREKMAIRTGHGTSRDAQTFYEVEERFEGFAALRVCPKTGRTHQIRVHLAHIGCPVLCDRLYGGRAQITRGEIRRAGEDDQVLLGRQALHARRLTFRHPSRRPTSPI